jgi:hypothetical protein
VPIQTVTEGAYRIREFRLRFYASDTMWQPAQEVRSDVTQTTEPCEQPSVWRSLQHVLERPVLFQRGFVTAPWHFSMHTALWEIFYF